jgi:glycerophosphoryl diester phosphodiesterase
VSAVPEPAPACPRWLAEVALAHRGLHGEGVPENSLAAFAAAAGAGYGVELDVHLSRDGVPVVHHDTSLDRLTGRDARIGELTAAQLAALRLAGTDQHVPTLAEVLRTMGDAPVMVELKQGRLRTGALEAATAAVIAGHPGPVCVAGFNPGSLRWFRKHRPAVVRVLTASPLHDTDLPALLRRRLAAVRDLPSVVPAAVSYDLTGLPNPATDAWRARGGVLVTWTVRDEAGLARARELADNLIFERVRP